jgi:hypothetical protein
LWLSGWLLGRSKPLTNLGSSRNFEYDEAPCSGICL